MRHGISLHAKRFLNIIWFLGHCECRENRKEILKERRAKRQKNFHVIQEATALWEVLRQGTTPKDKKRELVPQIIQLCGDRVAELASSHTASRIIQSCVKYGNANDQAAIQKQLMPKIVELSKSPYARFVVSKLIAQASKESLTGIYFIWNVFVRSKRPLIE